MPEMSGMEFAAVLAREHPALPLIVNSGCITDEMRRQAGALGVPALLQQALAGAAQAHS
jgi:DNA-binding NarL/FixJ family response regulator